MATHITSGTTTANTVTTVTFSNWYRSIEVDNRGSVDMWVRYDGIAPTIAGDDCVFVPANGFVQDDNPLLPPEPSINRTSNTQIQIITASACPYTIQVGV